MKHYIHHVPGRLRIRNPQLKNNNSQLSEVKNCFHNVPGITGIKCNALTGSILITYDSCCIPSEEIVKVLHECEYIDIHKSETLDIRWKRTFSQVGLQLGRACLGLMADRALKGTGLSFVTFLL